MATFDPHTNEDNHFVCYPGGRVQTFYMPISNFGNLLNYTDGSGGTTTYTYDEDGLGFLLTETDPLARTITYNERTIYGNPLKITYPDGSSELWTRDTLDLVLTHTDELGRITIYTRDSSHRVTKITYPAADDC